uniref:PID domain-containing protein n=1 Tax=Parastrongyloides trichosuri TaxID=131310 RepID=A0A0N5A501_PARTI
MLKKENKLKWLWNSKMPKSYFYIWYLGARESDYLRNDHSTILYLMKEQLQNSFTKIANKATVSLSQKGLKLSQSVPMMDKNGKIKMKSMDINIPAHCITFSMIGNPPFNDIVAVTMIILNPEMHSPIHVHIYRCDTVQIAQGMHDKIQYLIHQANNQRLLFDLEKRLYLKSNINKSRYMSEFDACDFAFKNNHIINDNTINSRSRHSIASLPITENNSENNNGKKLSNLTLEYNHRKSMENIFVNLKKVNPLPDTNTFDSNNLSKRLYIKQNNNTFSVGTQNSFYNKLFKRKRLPSSMLLYTDNH